MSTDVHASLGASGAHRWIACPGSIRLGRDIPDLETEYAKQGTAAHMLAERALKKGLEPHVWEGAKLNDVEVDIDMIEAVQVFVDLVRAAAEGSELFVEQRFSLEELNPPGPMFGTADAVVWDEELGLLEVYDYKHGIGYAVDAFENPQLMYYALGAVVKLKKRPKQIRVTIVQPRAVHPDGIVRRYEFSWDELVAFKKQLFEAARRTQESDAPLAIGVWCQFCKALAVCPEQKKHAVVVAQSEFEAMPVRGLPAPETLTQDEIVAVLEKRDLVEGWLRAVAQYVQAGLERGEEWPGWKLVPKRATRKWTDEEAAVKYLQGHEVDPFTQKVLSPAQAEKELRSLAPRGQKKNVKLPEELVVAESSGNNLVPDSDPRPAVPTGGEEFTALPPAVQPD